MAAINCILHPHHVSLTKHPYTLSSVLNQFQDQADPYYEVDGNRSHKGLIALKFDVCETEFAYLLYGEVPGVKDKQQISVEWLQSQTLFVRGSIKPEDTASESEIPKNATTNLAPLESMSPGFLGMSNS
jgi:HSP20 family molecular chaperone IbpA